MSRNLILIFGVLVFSLLYTKAIAKDLSCSVSWPAGTYTGEGRTIDEAWNDAQSACNKDQGPAEHACGSAPININCVDADGKCINHATFLRHGLMGGDQCK